MGRVEIQAAIKSTLEGVDGVENVYTNRKIISSVDAFVDAYMQADKQWVQTWTIRRFTTPIETAESTSYKSGVAVNIGRHWHFGFRIEFWLGIRDPDNKAGIQGDTDNTNVETRFQQLIDSVLEAFVGKRSLGGTTTEKPLALMDIRDDRLNSVFCQVATFEITVIQIRNDVPSV